MKEKKKKVEVEGGRASKSEFFFFLFLLSLLFFLSQALLSFALKKKNVSYRKRHQREPDVVRRRPHPPPDPGLSNSRGGERRDLDDHPKRELWKVRQGAGDRDPEVPGGRGRVADEGEASEGPEEDSCLVLSKEEAKERGEFFSPPLSSDDLEGKKKKKDKTTQLTVDPRADGAGREAVAQLVDQDREHQDGPVGEEGPEEVLFFFVGERNRKGKEKVSLFRGTSLA